MFKLKTKPPPISELQAGKVVSIFYCVTFISSFVLFHELHIEIHSFVSVCSSTVVVMFGAENVKLVKIAISRHQ